MTSYILKVFFLAPYGASRAEGFDTDLFYSEYYGRMLQVREALAPLFPEISFDE